MSNRINLIEIMKKRSGTSTEGTVELLEQLKNDIITELLKGNKVVWHNIFSLNLTQKAARLRRNPSTNAPVIIPPQRSIRFKVGKALKEKLNLETSEKNIFIISDNPDKFQELTKQLADTKIIPQFISSAKLLKENKEKPMDLQNILLALIDFPPDSPEYDEITFLLKMDNTLPLIGLIGLIPPNYDPLKMRSLKIICDRWVKNSAGLDELKEVILSDISRIEEERVFFKHRLKMRLPTENKYTEKLTTTLEKLIGEASFDSEQRSEFIAAIKESIMNGARHGNKNDKDKFLDIEYLVDKKKITLTIADEGPGFDYDQYIKRSEKSPQEILNQTRDKPSENGAGFGIVLMKKCVDELVYMPPGNILSLIKYFRSPRKT